MEIQPLTAQIDVVIDNTPLNIKIVELQNDIAELESEKTQLQMQLEELNNDNIELQNQISELNTQISNLQIELNDLLGDFDSLNGEIVTDKSSYALETKNLIADAIKNKGGIITPQTAFRSYASEINALETKKSGDPHTILLMNFDENPTKDSSIYEWDIEFIGNPIITSEQSAFGTKSLYLDANTYMHIKTDNFNPFGVDFTVEAWMRWIDFQYPHQYFYLLYQKMDHGFNKNGTTTKEYSRTIRVTNSSAGCDHVEYDSNHYIQPQSFSLEANTWYHIAFVRSSTNYATNYYFFVNGVKKTITYQNPSASNAYKYTLVPWAVFNTDVYLFSDNNHSWCPYGYINGFRISDVARYTEDFTPPNEPFTV